MPTIGPIHQSPGVDHITDGRIPSPDFFGNKTLSSYILIAKHFIRNHASFSVLYYDVGTSRVSQNIEEKGHWETLVSLVEDLKISLAFPRPFVCNHNDMKKLEKKFHLRLQRAGVPADTAKSTFSNKEPTSVAVWPPVE